MGRNGLGVEVRENSIRLSFTYEGRQVRKTLKVNGAPISPTPANVAYAERLAAEIRSRIKFGSFSMKEYFGEDDTGVGALTVGQHLTDWLKTQRIEASTKVGYEAAIKFWMRAICDKSGGRLADVHLRSLRLGHCTTAMAGRPDLSGKTLHNYLAVLKTALDAAVKDRLMDANPSIDVPIPKFQKPPPDPFTRSELEMIVQAMEAQHPGHVSNYTEFWFWTGMRTSELIGLRWENVNLTLSQVIVSEASVKGNLKGTKTNKSRTLLLNSRAKAALLRQGELTKSGIVFRNPRTLEPWQDDDAFFRQFWRPVLKSLGIRYRRPYNCRHTYATTMLMSGLNPAFCAGQLGHTVDMFLTTYARWIDGDRNALEMRRLEAGISGQTN